MEDPAQPLAGRHAVVTGAAGGIGGAIVQHLASHGAVVHGLDRDLPGLAHLSEKIGKAGRFTSYAVDLTDRAATDHTVRDLSVALGGRCDILVNNVGVSRLKSFADSDDALFDFLYAVNVAAPFRVTRALLPALKASGHASVINIASELALVGQPGYTAYCGTKGALLAWSRALAVELASDAVRVNALCPGPVDTAMLQAEFATADSAERARCEEIASIPLDGLGCRWTLLESSRFWRAMRQSSSPGRHGRSTAVRPAAKPSGGCRIR